jgi:hypothetical protein
MSVEATWQEHVDRQLMEQGAFAPLELLFNSGRLFYEDYATWRRREIEVLDTVLMGNTERIRAEMERATRYARSIGLVEQSQDFYAWDTESASSGKPLRVSADPALQRLLSSRYVPAQSAPQMDLFFDNPVVALANGIVRALSRRDQGEAQRQLDRLYALSPNHAELPAFDRLVETVGRLGHPNEDPQQELTAILEISPIAQRILGSQCRDLLAPLWQQLAHLPGTQSFSADQPTLHRSFALTQAQDWRGVRESVLSEPEWWLQAPLCLRLVESAYRQRHRVEALTAWCHLCWRSPELAPVSVERLRQYDLTRLWQRFVDVEEDFPPPDQAPEPLLTAADFPAWLLLQEPGLAQSLAVDLPTGQTPAEEHFRCINRWIHARRNHRDAEEMELRKALQASHPLLFRLLRQGALTRAV